MLYFRFLLYQIQQALYLHSEDAVSAGDLTLIVGVNTLVCGLGCCCTELLLGGRGSGFEFEFPARLRFEFPAGFEFAAGFEIGASPGFRETGVPPMEPSPFGMIIPSGYPLNFHLTLPRWSTLLGLWTKLDLKRMFSY